MFSLKKIFAYEESEKYKEGKYIIERSYLAKNTGAINDMESVKDDDFEADD